MLDPAIVSSMKAGWRPTLCSSEVPHPMSANGSVVH
jgi:hypothetical protein